jgi:hypothetical protein
VFVSKVEFAVEPAFQTATQFVLRTGFIIQYVAGSGNEYSTGLALQDLGAADPELIVTGTTTGSVDGSANRGGVDGWAIRTAALFPFTRKWQAQVGTPADDGLGAVISPDDVIFGLSGQMIKISRDNAGIAYTETVAGSRRLLGLLKRGVGSSASGFVVQSSTAGTGFVLDERIVW